MQKPNVKTARPEVKEYILLLTLGLDSASQAYFQNLREQYYPRNLNVIPAHVSLFHNLPGSEIDTISHDIEAILPRVPFGMQVSRLHFMGKGSLFYLESAQLNSLHRDLSSRWQQWLIPQDKQGYKPHVVVQNKTDPQQAKADYQTLSDQFKPFKVTAQSLLLWEYLGGPWRLERTFTFTPEA